VAEFKLNPVSGRILPRKYKTPFLGKEQTRAAITEAIEIRDKGL
jgi:hypothetical protein